jgi:hypothetical protein
MDADDAPSPMTLQGPEQDRVHDRQLLPKGTSYVTAWLSTSVCFVEAP